MSHAGNIPLVRLVMPLVMGIIAWLVVRLPVPPLLFWSFFLNIILLWVALIPFSKAHYSHRWIFGLLFQLLFFMTGYFHAQNHHQLARKDHFSHYTDQEGHIKLRILHPVSPKANSFQVMTRVEELAGDSMQRRVSGRLLLYLRKDSAAARLRYGDVLVIENFYNQVQPPGNPGEFNYRAFLTYQNVFHQAFRDSGQWFVIQENHGHWLISKALLARQRALQTLHHHLGPGHEYAVVSALLLGQREELDQNLQREFAGAGAMHILCVSGLHVGIIYLVLKFLLSFLKKLPAGMFIQTVAIVLLLWFYAAITGFLPPVLRACTMFSFVALGQNLKRSTNIYNTLAASALVLVLVDPFIITRIGFQLSYIAVTGIVSLQPWLYKKICFNNYLASRAWAIITVSLAAQLATAPLVLYYFHQFPNYFLLTNLLVIPLAGFVIYSAILTLLLSPLPFLSILAGKLLFWLTSLMHGFVRFVEALPYATSSGLFINLGETLMISAFIIGLMAWMISFKRRTILVTLIVLMAFSISIAWRTIQNDRQRQVVIYQVDKSLAIDFYSGKQCVFLSCDALQEQDDRLHFHLSGHRLARGITLPGHWVMTTHRQPFENDWMYREGPFVRFYGISFYILDHDMTKEQVPVQGVAVDYLIVSKNPAVDLNDVLQVFHPGQVVFDSSCSPWKISQWEQCCMEAGIPCHTLSSQGALVIHVPWG
ncbi:MAG: ComEC/Rec2 family competence protein [Bacteroidales bacterium]